MAANLLFYAAVFFAVAGDVAEGIGEPEDQHAEGRDGEQGGEEVDAEGVEVAATTRITETAFLAYKLSPNAEHAVPNLLNEEYRGLVLDGSGGEQTVL